MSFLGLMTVKAHEAAVAHFRDTFALQGATIVSRDATISRLQRENARLLDELATLRPDAEKYRRSVANLKQNRNRKREVA